jgi:hypothetical protein
MDRSASSIKLIAASRPKKETPGHRLRAQFQALNFGTVFRVAESCQHKTTMTSFFLAVAVSVRASA